MRRILSFIIVVTATVSLEALMLSYLINTADIGTVSPELETANNTALAAIFIGRWACLPLVMREY